MSQKKPGLMKQVDVGFDVDRALIGAIQAAEELNAQYGDWVNTAAVAASVKQFIKETPKEFFCRNCGWRQKNGGCPANGMKPVGDTDTCDAFLHAHEYVDTPK